MKCLVLLSCYFTFCNFYAVVLRERVFLLGFIGPFVINIRFVGEFFDVVIGIWSFWFKTHFIFLYGSAIKVMMVFEISFRI